MLKKILHMSQEKILVHSSNNYLYFVYTLQMVLIHSLSLIQCALQLLSVSMKYGVPNVKLAI